MSQLTHFAPKTAHQADNRGKGLGPQMKGPIEHQTVDC